MSTYSNGKCPRRKNAQYSVLRRTVRIRPKYRTQAILSAIGHSVRGSGEAHKEDGDGAIEDRFATDEVG